MRRMQNKESSPLVKVLKYSPCTSTYTGRSLDQKVNMEETTEKDISAKHKLAISCSKSYSGVQAPAPNYLLRGLFCFFFFRFPNPPPLLVTSRRVNFEMHIRTFFLIFISETLTCYRCKTWEEIAPSSYMFLRRVEPFGAEMTAARMPR
jgi:hypothetical protein